MAEMKLHIGEHVFHIITYSSDVQSFFEQHYLPCEDTAANADMTVVVHDGYGKAFDTYDVEIASREGVIVYTRTDYRIDVDDSFTRASLQVQDVFALKHAMMNLFSAFAAHRGWGLLIHSSCIMDREQAYLFAGPSGAGKSTVALLSRPRQVLSDEATIVKITDSEAVIYDSPFRSDLGLPSRRQGTPLRAIQLLRQATENRREPLSQVEGMMGVMDKVFFWSPNVTYTQRVMGLCHRLATVVPVYELYFQKNDTFWEEIC
ncbi:hypothetical protein [Paenibacillus daejeonensis]|uniref:hypothetical protein n=1 Tax=Paenibacillus daejeonensis TaxID=135193 RepID=UPI0003756D99|nr:hypothetical protein [Paenibacillus daejeonensis]